MVKPAVLPAGKKAGVGIHIASLAGPHGIGDIADTAHRFLNKLVAMQVAVWQFLPTGPTAYGDSPYQPLSAFAGNEMLIGMDPLIRLGLLAEEEVQVLTKLSLAVVDYGSLIPLKNALLAKAANRFRVAMDSELKSAYEDFLQINDDNWLSDYATYRVLKSLHDERPWPEWDSAYAQRDALALNEFQQANQASIDQVKIVQFLFEQQWKALKQQANGLGIQLFGDMPIYLALDSADAWAHPEILLLNEAGMPSHVAGVPPDYFSSDGQLWGNPLYDWKFHERSGYQWWIERVQHAASHLDLVRIDHFRGFESFWAVPYGSETAREGEWLPGPGDGLFDAIESALGALPIVAEDLGVITAEVDDLRRRHQIPGMKVLQFLAGDPAFSLDSIDEHCVCYTGTHDNDTTVGWFNGADEDTRSDQEILESQQNVLKLTGGTSETVHLDMIRMAFNSRARLAIVPMQDLLGLGSEARLNIPGTTLNNWRWRVGEHQLSEAFCGSVAQVVVETGRE